MHSDQTFARRWGHQKSSRLLLVTAAEEPQRHPGLAQGQNEALAGEGEVHVASKPWGQVAHPSLWSSAKVLVPTGAPHSQSTPRRHLQGLPHPTLDPCPLLSSASLLALMQIGDLGLVLEWEGFG